MKTSQILLLSGVALGGFFLLNPVADDSPKSGLGGFFGGGSSSNVITPTPIEGIPKQPQIVYNVNVESPDFSKIGGYNEDNNLTKKEASSSSSSKYYGSKRGSLFIVEAMESEKQKATISFVEKKPIVDSQGSLEGFQDTKKEKSIVASPFQKAVFSATNQIVG